MVNTNSLSRKFELDGYVKYMQEKAKMFDDYCEEEMMNEQTTDVTVTAEGLKAYINDMVGLLEKKRSVSKVAPETGRSYRVIEDIPEEELFTLVVIRTTKEGKFVVQANNHDLSRLNEQDNQNAQAQKYAKVS